MTNQSGQGDAFEYSEVYGGTQPAPEAAPRSMGDFSPIQSLGYNELRQPNNVSETPRKLSSKTVSTPSPAMQNRRGANDQQK